MEMLIALSLLVLPPLALGLVVLAAIKPEARARLLETWHLFSRSLPGRLVLLVVTGVLLTIPMEMVEALRTERGYRLDAVRNELATEWGSSQTVVGPLIWVPVVDQWEEPVETTDRDGNVKVHLRPQLVRRGFLVLPDELSVRGGLVPQALHRGLYDVLVYGAAVQIDATFAKPELPVPAGHTVEALWDEAELVVHLSDLSAVSALRHVSWEGTELERSSGKLPGSELSGIRAPLAGWEGDRAVVAVALDLRGMDDLMVGALGENSEVELKGTWDDPSFRGFTLPKEREVGDGGFVGRWSVPGVARPVARLVNLSEVDAYPVLATHTVGVQLVEPASAYASVERALTYGVLVIVLCLLTFLVLEHGLDLKLHPVQWLVNGMALVVFYLVLLATSEHRGFELAYGIASALTIGMMTGYTLLATRALRAAGSVLASLAILYGCMFLMLRSEDFALLTGTALVVVALGGTMWVTRHLGRSEPEVEPEPVVVQP